MKRSLNILDNTDWLAVILYLVLVIFGWMNIFSVTYSETDPSFFSTNNRYFQQLIWMVVSLIAAVLIFLIDGRFFIFIAYPVYGLSMLLLLSVFAFPARNEAHSWIDLGPASIQPAEFAKVAALLALSKFLSGYNIKSNSIRNILISLLIIAVPMILILAQPDVGSMIVYSAFLLVLYREGLPGWILLLVMIFAALFLAWFKLNILAIAIILSILGFAVFAVLNKHPRTISKAFGIIAGCIILGFILKHINVISIDKLLVYILFTSLGIIICVSIAVAKKIKGWMIAVGFLIVFTSYLFTIDFVFNNILKQHHQDRVLIMLGIKSDPWGYGYNINQSKIAIGSGGFAGRGYMQGPQTKLKYVPEQSTDFIFCTIGEEWGFLGSLLFLSIFVGLLTRLIIIAERQRSRFSRIYGYGVVVILFFHFAINIAMTLNLFPVIGIPLPFISYGGSSLLAFTILLFILLRLDSTRKAYLI